MFKIRKKSFRKSFAARTSLKRVIKTKIGLRAPKGWGILTNPKRALRNKAQSNIILSLLRLLLKGR